jgi:hypothetical protein
MRQLIFWDFVLTFLISGSIIWGQVDLQKDKFRQLKEELATPNVYRTASGAPGHEYWQQRADYIIDIELDDQNQRISGVETITYYNQSPDPLDYLWIQLDQNMRALDSKTPLALAKKLNLSNTEILSYLKEQGVEFKNLLSPVDETTRQMILSELAKEKETFQDMQKFLSNFDGGFKLEYVKGADGKALAHVINRTMLRIDLQNPLQSGESFVLEIKWWYNINDRKKIGGRSGLEYFPGDDNYLYTIAQFYPRMAVYSDVEGWQNKQFLGRGEFTLTFGNYDVRITVPADHVVAATGILQNPIKVLNAAQRSRLKDARTSSVPVFIITEDKAMENERSRTDRKKTWRFKAENVRDFAFASSRKFIWDAMGVPMGDRIVMAMSYYPKEGNPLWEKYSTRIVAHTLENYSKFTFDYPYPVAISVHAIRIGMEYPMICFNGGRPEADGTYSKRTKYGMLSVIIHEVGHNYFPMIVNSDERQWTWMDEGLNTFLQYLSEQAWEPDYPSRRGPARKIVGYMKGDKSQQMPIMTNSESLLQFGNNAYGKPATALNILRETILGRDLFDFAFKQYAQRWMFKHPTPADLFRTLEDASGVDLDWFWRGWFYSTDHVDISLDIVKWYQIDTKDPNIEKPFLKEKKAADPENISSIRNREELVTVTEQDTSMLDFYNRYDQFEITAKDVADYEDYFASFDDVGQELLNSGYNFYELTFSNVGGLVMPIILDFKFSDGNHEIQRIPAEIWRFNPETVNKVFAFKKELVSVTLDPYLETADVDHSNNSWPPLIEPTRFKLFKESQTPSNPMQQHKKRMKKNNGNKGAG